MRQVGERIDAWGTSLRQGRTGFSGIADIGGEGGRVFRLPRRTWMEAASSFLWHSACSRLVAEQSPLHPDRMMRGCGVLAGSSVYIVQESGLLVDYYLAQVTLGLKSLVHCYFSTVRNKELHNTHSGKEVTTFRLSSNLRKKKENGLW